MTENNLHNSIPLINHICFTGITIPTTPKIAPKYDIFNYSVLLYKHDSLILDKD